MTRSKATSRCAVNGALRIARSHLKRVRDDFGDSLSLAVTPERIDKYIETRLTKKRGLKGEVIHGDCPASINRALQLLGQVFNLVVKRGTLSRAPYIRKLSEADNVRQSFFSEAEIGDVLANLPNDGLRDFVEWAACTGQRNGEIASLTWDMVDGSEIRIPGEVCKNRRPRVITQLAEPIFHRGDGLPVGEFKKSWATATKKAQCAGKLFHDLRRTCARRLLAAGVPQVIARDLTGHRTSAMFDHYAIVSSADVLAAQKKVAEFRKQA